MSADSSSSSSTSTSSSSAEGRGKGGKALGANFLAHKGLPGKAGGKGRKGKGGRKGGKPGGRGGGQVDSLDRWRELQVHKRSLVDLPIRPGAEFSLRC